MKNLLLLGGVALVAVSYYGKRKVTEIRNVIDSLILGVSGIHNFNFAAGNLTFDIDLKIANPTNQALNVQTGNLITVKRLLFYSQKGDFIGESFPNLSSIEIPAHGSISIKNLATQINTSNLGNLINNALSIFTDANNLQVKAEIESLGKIYMI